MLNSSSSKYNLTSLDVDRSLLAECMRQRIKGKQTLPRRRLYLIPQTQPPMILRSHVQKTVTPLRIKIPHSPLETHSIIQTSVPKTQYTQPQPTIQQSTSSPYQRKSLPRQAKNRKVPAPEKTTFVKPQVPDPQNEANITPYLLPTATNITTPYHLKKQACAHYKSQSEPEPLIELITELPPNTPSRDHLLFENSLHLHREKLHKEFESQVVRKAFGEHPKQMYKTGFMNVRVFGETADITSYIIVRKYIVYNINHDEEKIK